MIISHQAGVVVKITDDGWEGGYHAQDNDDSRLTPARCST